MSLTISKKAISETVEQPTLLRIHPNDNVAVAIQKLNAGTELVFEGASLIIKDDIDRGHKVALETLSEGANILKYGAAIGHASADILRGQWVHTHNVKTNLNGVDEYIYKPEITAVESVSNRQFKGYKRTDGKVGIRNDIWIIPTVSCVNKVGEQLVRMKMSDIENSATIDSIETLAHPYGCSQLGDDHENTRKILAQFCAHPNAGGVLVLSLGCENNTLDRFKELTKMVDPARIRYLKCQDAEDEIEQGLDLLDELIENCKTDQREDCSLSELTIGLKCGGSDGLSGITANPLLGAVSDKLIKAGGSSILTEVPEMFGAEHLLFNRCINESVFNKAVDMVNGFKNYFKRHNQEIYENPSPGNKAGGITTLEDKSLGCTQKGGISPVVDVLDYAQSLKIKGLNLLSAPGNDPVAVTALAASGAQLVLFTTGRGTPFGGPVPTVKISTNTSLAEHKKRWIDFNAGTLVEGDTMEVLSENFLDYIVDLASGNIQSANEINGYKEISIFKDGVTL